MRVIREIEVAGLKIQVRELTVGEIRAWLKDSGMVSGDLVDAALFEEFSLPDLLRMTDLTTETVAASDAGRSAPGVRRLRRGERRFFRNAEPGAGAGAGGSVRGLETAALALAANGHAAVWDYPWGVFSLACELSSRE